MKTCHHLLLYFALATTLLACLDSDIHLRPVQLAETKIVILNEGNYTYGNASISVWQPSEVLQKVFRSQNARPLGDVAQSLFPFEDKYFLVINNSEKIEVVDKNFKSLHTITGLTSPRYICQINDTLAYVSDLYAGAISLLHLRNYKLLGQIKTGKPTEQMLRYKHKVFVNNWSYGNDTVQVIDTRNHQIIKSLKVGKDPSAPVLDHLNRLWTFGQGETKNSTLIKLFNPEDHSLIQELHLPHQHARNPKLNPAKDSLYYLSSSYSSGHNSKTYGIYKMAIKENFSASDFPTKPFIQQKKGNLFYNFFIQNDSSLYISDAIDYVQNGVIFHYLNGAKKDSARVGVIPQFIHFETTQ